jgi:predicted RNA binding protein YcfA (HicA-like mRNA interferase family)
MPKLPRWTAAEAEKALLLAAFKRLRSKGSHRIYGKIIDESAETSAPER